MTSSAKKTGITARRVGEILSRQKLVSALAFLIILVIGSAVVLTRPTVYRSSSSVALLPTNNPNILPNYPNLMVNLIPTYVQLVSSPVLLDQVAAKLPFPATEAQLATDLHAESLSSAAIINIVAEARSPARATSIASAATGAFLAQVRGNGLVVPRIYSQPTAAEPAPPGKTLLLAVVLLLAIALGAAAGLIWERFVGPPPWSTPWIDPLDASGIPGRTGTPRHAQIPSERTAALASGAAAPVESFETVRLRPPSSEIGTTDASSETGWPGGQ